MDIWAIPGLEESQGYGQQVGPAVGAVGWQLLADKNVVGSWELAVGTGRIRMGVAIEVSSLGDSRTMADPDSCAERGDTPRALGGGLWVRGQAMGLGVEAGNM
jgi:hypothetical protein